MKFERVILAVVLLAGGIGPALAFPENGCEMQRKQYPANWTDTSAEKPLFNCYAPQADPLRIKLGATDGAGRTMMSVVPLSRPDGNEEKDNTLRIWLDAEQARRLRDGKYFATVLRKEDSCWIRGDLDGAPVFVLDSADPPPDNPGEAGSFYNKAPRFSIFGGEAYFCERAK